MDTTDHTYGDIASLIDLYTGGIDYSVSAFSNRTDNKDYMPVFRFKAKGLTQNLDKLVDLLKEISLHTVFTNKDRLAELVEETKAGWDMDAFRRGHTIVMHRVLSYVSPVEAFCDAGELSYYQFITDIAGRIRSDADEIGAKLSAVMKKIFTRSALTLEVTASQEDWKTAKVVVPAWIQALPQGEKPQGLCDFGLSRKNEGIMTSGTVQYVAKGAPLAAAGGLEDGSLGTSFEKIMAAVEAVDQGDGVACIMDMGSAVMTAEMVVESLEDRKIQLLDCPFVEGAVITAIEAAGGTPLAAMQDKVEASRDRKL